jgi:hypothetical protein
MLARCIAGNDSKKYLGVVGFMFKQQHLLIAQPRDTVNFIGKLNGMNEQDVATCVRDQAQLDKFAPEKIATAGYSRPSPCSAQRRRR